MALLTFSSSNIGQGPLQGALEVAGLRKVTAEVKEIIKNKMRADDETIAYQLYQLSTSKGYVLSLGTILRCRTTLGWTFHGVCYCVSLFTLAHCCSHLGLFQAIHLVCGNKNVCLIPVERLSRSSLQLHLQTLYWPHLFTALSIPIFSCCLRLLSAGSTSFVSCSFWMKCNCCYYFFSFITGPNIQLKFMYGPESV